MLTAEEMILLSFTHVTVHCNITHSDDGGWLACYGILMCWKNIAWRPLLVTNMNHHSSRTSLQHGREELMENCRPLCSKLRHQFVRERSRLASISEQGPSLQENCIKVMKHSYYTFGLPFVLYVHNIYNHNAQYFGSTIQQS